MAKLKRQDMHRIMAHIESIQAILSEYGESMEAFDDICQIDWYVQDIRELIG